jgi:hypothetical protein
MMVTSLGEVRAVPPGERLKIVDVLPETHVVVC